MKLTQHSSPSLGWRHRFMSPEIHNGFTQSGERHDLDTAERKTVGSRIADLSAERPGGRSIRGRASHFPRLGSFKEVFVQTPKISANDPLKTTLRANRH